MKIYQFRARDSPVSTGRKLIFKGVKFRGGELSSQETRGRFQREIYVLQCSVLQLLVACCQSGVQAALEVTLASVAQALTLPMY